MPTSPLSRIVALNAFHASRCGASGERANRSRSSNERQCCTSIGLSGPLNACVVPSSPACGWASSHFSIFGIAVNTGHHCRTFHGRLMRIPIMNTTTSSS